MLTDWIKEPLIPSQTVLVVAGSGFIGRHTLARLTTHGHTVYATHLPSKAPPAMANVTWLPCDLTAKGATTAWPRHCDSLIYLAQSSAWRDFPAGAADVFQVNVAAALQAAAYAQHAGVQRFIFASSGTVYNQTTQPAREDQLFDLHTPRSFYAASKLATELLLGPYAALFAVEILRFFMPYGSGQDSKMLLPQLVQRVCQGQPISLHGVDGLQANPVAVADVAETLERCLALNTSATLNVAGPEVLSLREIGLCIGRVLGLTPYFETRPDQIPPLIVGETAILQATLGWTPKTRLEEGLQAWLKPATNDI